MLAGNKGRISSEIKFMGAGTGDQSQVCCTSELRFQSFCKFLFCPGLVPTSSPPVSTSLSAVVKGVYRSAGNYILRLIFYSAVRLLSYIHTVTEDISPRLFPDNETTKKTTILTSSCIAKLPT